MTILFIITLLLYLVVCGVLISLILAQEGKGGGLSGVMGSSMGETFGFGGANKTIKKFTSIAATVFLVLSVILTFIGDAMINSAGDSFIGSNAPVANATAPAGKKAGETAAPAAKPGTNAPTMEVKTETGPAAPVTGAPASSGNSAAGPAPKMPSAAAPAAPAAPQPAQSNPAAPATTR
jgi:protein translocase SecG subunit